jgi:hypothetical protein
MVNLALEWEIIELYGKRGAGGVIMTPYGKSSHKMGNHGTAW